MKNRRLALAMAFAMTVTSLPVNGLTGYAAEEFSEVEPVTEAGAADGETVLDEAEVIAEDDGEAEALEAEVSGDASGASDDEHGAAAPAEQSLEATDVAPFVESVEVVEQSDDGEEDDNDWRTEEGLIGSHVFLYANWEPDATYQWYTSEARDSAQSTYTAFGGTSYEQAVPIESGRTYCHCKITSATEDGTETVTWNHFQVTGKTLQPTMVDEETTVAPGGMIKLSAEFEACAGKSLFYQWYQRGEDGDLTLIEGATSADYTAENITGDVTYVCRAYTDDLEDGDTADVCFSITVATGFWVGEDQECKAKPGESLTLTADASSDEGELTYQWARRVLNAEEDRWELEAIEGADDSSYTIKDVQKNETFVCTVSNGSETKEVSFEVSVDSGLDYAETASIDVGILSPGQSITLHQDAKTNYGPLTYRWWMLGEPDEDGARIYEPIPGATNSADCVIENPKLNADGEYLCVVSDRYNTGETRYSLEGSMSTLQIAVDDWERNLLVAFGDELEMEVTATSTISEKITYQWRKCVQNGEEWIPDGDCIGTESILCIQNVTESGAYCCKVSDGVSTEEVTFLVQMHKGLQVQIPPEIAVKAGESVTLEANARTNSELPLTYQWQTVVRDENYHEEITNIDGATDQTYTVENVQGPCIYKCEVSDGYSTSGIYYEIQMDTGLKFDNPEYPTVATIPARPDQELVLDASASADGGVQYKWYYRDGKTGEWTFLENVTGATCKVDFAKSKYYKCEIYDKYGQGLDTQFQLTVDTGLEASIVEKTVTVPYGKQAVLSVDVSDAATNYGPLSYEWYKVTEKGDERLEGADGASYTTPESFTHVIENDIDYYYYMCVVRDQYNSKKINFKIEIASNLVVKTPDLVWVENGGSVDLKAEATSDYGPVEYLWGAMMTNGQIWGLGGFSEDSAFPQTDVTDVVQYVCTARDQTGMVKSVSAVAAPLSFKGKDAPDFEHARTFQILGDSAENRAIILQPGGSAYFKLIPDRNGPWNFYTDTSNATIAVYDSERNLLDKAGDEEDSWGFNLTLNLKKGVTYYIECSYQSIWGEIKKAGSYEWYGGYEGDEFHEYDEGVVVKEPTCTESGKIVYTCKDCGYEYAAPLPATGAHQMITVVEKAATCGTAGSQHRECSVCHTKEASTEIPATGAHQMTTIIDQAATCGAAGSQHQECSICHTKEASSMIPPTGAHQYGAYHVTKQATIFAAGDEVKTCSVCGASEHRSIPQKQGTITLTATKLPLQVRKSVALSKIVTGLAAGDSIASCVSSNPNVATVDNSGKVTGKKAGTAVITITLASGVPAKVTVTVQKKAVATAKIMNVEKSLKLNIGDKKTLQPVISPITTTDKMSYTSSNKKVATVTKGGVILAKKSGTANITVKAGKKKVTVKVTVAKKAPTGMNGVPASKTLKAKKSFTIKPKLTPSGAEAKITYKSSNSKVVTVNAKGKVTAKKAGTAVITVKADGVVRTCTVTVK
ncbi:MAG: Ig-like domain-containing protein [Lachnospiraceae bacterium]|nr:Ig-like domain-containing protein [Lachnospiraceae bacterium]